MREKIKFQNGSIYDLASGGAYFGDEIAKLILVLPDGKAYDEVEADVTGNDSIYILDADGNTQKTRTGYAYLDLLAKKNDYVIGDEQVESGTNEETGEVIYMNRDIVGTVMIVDLKKADVRQELAALKAKVKEQSETIDMMLVADLEV